MTLLVLTLRLHLHWNILEVCRKFQQLWFICVDVMIKAGFLAGLSTLIQLSPISRPLQAHNHILLSTLHCMYGSILQLPAGTMADRASMHTNKRQKAKARAR